MDNISQKSLNPKKEYVSSNPYIGYLPRILPNTADFYGNLQKTCDDMLEDPKISKCINLLKTRIIGRGLEVIPRYSESHPEYENAAAVANFIQILLSKLEKPLRFTLEQMLDGLIYGYKISEITWDTIEVGKQIYFLPYKIKVKDNKQLSFIVDEFNNVIGFKFGGNFAYSSASVIRNKKGNKLKINDKEFEFLDKEKFMVFTFRPKNEDPRGTSILSAAYKNWKLKQDIYPEYLRYLLMCAIPLLVGTTPEGEDSIHVLRDSEGNILNDANGNPEAISSVTALMEALANARNATAIALKGGSNVKEIGVGSASSGGVAFYNALEFLNQEIEDSILLQTLGTSQAVYQPKASSQIHMSTLDEFISNLRIQIIDMLIKSIFSKAIIYNLGEKYLQYMPIISLRNNARRDFAASATAIAALKKVDYFTEDQLIRIDADFDLPPRQSSRNDINLSMTESIELNRKLLEQEKIQYEIELQKQDINLKKLEGLVNFRKMLIGNILTKDSQGNEKVTTTSLNLQEETVGKIDSAINFVVNDFMSKYNLDKSIDLGKIQSIVSDIKSKETPSELDIPENLYPSKTNTIVFKSRLKKLFNRASIDF